MFPFLQHSRTPGSRSRQGQQFRPRLEYLEDRTTPTIVFTPSAGALNATDLATIEQA
jgi:hypothetical protein